jgi:hypothetical protein
MVDVLSKTFALSFTASTSPPTSGTGDRYVLRSSGTGAWTGINANEIAEYDGSTWSHSAPVAGLRLVMEDTGAYLTWDSASWVSSLLLRASAMPFDPLSTIDAKAAALGAALLIDRSFSLGANTVLTAPVIIFGGGVITLGAFNLTLPSMSAGNFRCFNASSTGTVTITAGASVNALWFGAIGVDDGPGGTNDNTIPLDAAFACVKNFAKGGELYVPAGIYPVRGTAGISATVASRGGLTIRGDGRRSSILYSYMGSGTGPIGTLLAIGDPTDAAATDGVAIIDMGFGTGVRASGSVTGEAELLHLHFCRDARLSRCTFQGGFATQLVVAHPQGVTIRDSNFNGTVQGSPALFVATKGIDLVGGAGGTDAGQAARIINCTIRDFMPVNGPGIGIHLEAGSGSEFAVVDCDIENNDISIKEEVGRNRFLHNSMESSKVTLTIAAANNTGGGAITAAGTPLLATAQLGTYTIVCTTAGAGAGTFTVHDPVGTVIGTVTASAGGTAFANQIAFTINVAGADYIVGDTFVFSVSGTAVGNAVVTVSAGKNTGTGSLTSSASTLFAEGAVGTFLVVCSSSSAFDVYDPLGTHLGTGVVGSAFAMYPPNPPDTWTITVNSGVAAGDNFRIASAGCVLFQVGTPSLVVGDSLYAQNTLSMDGLRNGKFFDLQNCEYIQIVDNEFIEPAGYNVYCSPLVGSVPNALRGNSSLDPRTGMYFDPAVIDGSWIVKDNVERSTLIFGDTSPDGETLPNVANLQTLLFANSKATTVTDFIRGYNGQELTVLQPGSQPATTLKNGSAIKMLSGKDEVVFNTNYIFRAVQSVGATAPAWQQIAPVPVSRTLQSETTAYLAAGTTAGAAAYPLLFQYAVDDLVIALKAAGIWTTLDALWLFAVNDLLLGQINMIHPAAAPITWHTTGSAVTFTPYYAVTGNAGSNNYGDTGLLQNGGTNFVQNSASLSVWSPVNTTQNTYAIGSSGVGSQCRMAPHNNAKIVGRLMDGTTFNPAPTSAVAGLASLVRDSATTRESYRNGVLLGNDTGVASIAPPANSIYLMFDQQAAVYHTLPLSMAAIGGSRSAGAEANFYNALVPFMRFVGLA